MSNDTPAERVAVIWRRKPVPICEPLTARSPCRSSYCVDRLLAIRNGDVKERKPPRTGLRLRCGDYRPFFDCKDPATIEITGVRNRSEAYRR